jgi:hypothetical protein
MLESRCEFLPISFEIAPGGGARIRTGDQGFAGPCLTTWLRRLERLLYRKPLTSPPAEIVAHRMYQRDHRASIESRQRITATD